ncbi:leucine--tRNA ligase [Candidatus Gottesmanbacteria bacterium]|nr:leucine--tRNA ligase [Candidatus Gottesmanbacteria bacterium]
MKVKKKTASAKNRSQGEENKQGYDHSGIEKAWQHTWEETKLNKLDLRGADNPFYNLMMFPYPSAEGLHVGNMYAFTGSDIYGRFKRMQGFRVFEPIGLDGFGIHSENYALKIGKHPVDQAEVSEKNFYRQLRAIGCMFDWSRTVETYDPDYYKWTQWIFVQMFKHGLAYRDTAQVNWCPKDKTVLADEQVIPASRQGGDGKCERCGNIVEKRSLEQWFFRITAYAEKLLQNTFSLKWSEKVLVAQRNWIGKKEGINITYTIVNGEKSVGKVVCFTTRPDTNFGATFVVIAPEHPVLAEITKLVPEKTQHEIAAYVKEATAKSAGERIAEGRKKTGVFTGLYCVNQLNQYKMPLYVSDFVLMDVGTGAVVGVPGHDRRDFEFAQEKNIPVVRVVVGKDGDTSPITNIEQVQEQEGKMINSEFLNGLDIHEATFRMMDHLEKKGWGKRITTYHLRDWLISRQRYWGPPIPMIYCKKCAADGHGERAEMPGWYTVPMDDLPILLPRIADYKPGDDGIAPLAKHKEFYETKCPGCGSKAVRETDVSDTFLDSSWYFLRYPSVAPPDGPNENFVGSPAVLEKTRRAASALPWDPDITKKWLPVSMYTGGAEHSVLHLMYSRFVTMALHDWGYLDFDEPFPNFYAHGLVIKEGAKMSKSKGNVVNPDEYIKLYGTDALRLYLMFMGPFDEGGDFRDASMEGMNRWVGRVWRLTLASLKATRPPANKEVERALHRLIKKVGEDMEKRRYNTAIASMMEFTNFASDHGGLDRETLKSFTLLLAPFAPYLTEELWQKAHGYKAFQPSQSVHVQSWPAYNPKLLVEDRVRIIIQVNGKLRDAIDVSLAQSKVQKEIEALAQRSEKVQKHLAGRPMRKVVFVPGKLINFVI